MATYFVSNAGSNTAPYDTEAKAATTLAVIAALPWAATDIVKISSTHVESTAGAVSYTFPTTPGMQVVSVAFNGSGTGAAAAGASVSVSGNFSLTLSAGFVYGFGIIFQASNANNTAADFNVGGAAAAVGQVWESCSFVNRSVNASATFAIGSTSPVGQQTFKFINCSYNAGDVARICSLRSGTFEFIGLTLIGTAPTTVFQFAASLPNYSTFTGCDLSGVAWTNLFNVAAATTANVLLAQCELVSGFTVATGSFGVPGVEIVLVDCNSGDVNYYYRKDCWQGTVLADNTVYLTGSGDGINAVSLLVGANQNSFIYPLALPPFVFFNSTLGAMTTTVEIANNSATTFTNAQIWQETLAKVTSGSPLGTWNVADRVASVIATPANQDSSTTPWTGSVSSFQKLVSGSLTPAEVGQITVQVYIASTTTCYVSPKVLSGSAAQWLNLSGQYVNDPPAAAGATAAKVIGGYYG